MNIILTKTRTKNETVVNYVTVLMRDVPGDARRRLWDQMFAWCDENLRKGTWSRHALGDASGSLFIHNDADAFAFKLRWHGIDN